MSMTTTQTRTERRTYKGRGCNGPVLRAPPKMPGKLLRCRAKSEDFERKLLPRFELSDELYELAPTATTSSSDISTTTPLLSLPLEILYHIYQTLDHSPSQIAFALSCKQMALIARELDLNLSTHSPKYAGFLPRNVFDVPALMRSLTTWMPSHLQLCDHCLTMRPHAKEYWADVDGCEVSNFWITKTGWQFSNASWHKQVHNICPACHVSCSLSDYVDCDGCRALGRLGDVDWSRVSDHWRRRNQAELIEMRGTNVEEEVELPSTDIWDLNA